MRIYYIQTKLDLRFYIVFDDNHRIIGSSSRKISLSKKRNTNSLKNRFFHPFVVWTAFLEPGYTFSEYIENITIKELVRWIKRILSLNGGVRMSTSDFYELQKLYADLLETADQT